MSSDCVVGTVEHSLPNSKQSLSSLKERIFLYKAEDVARACIREKWSDVSTAGWSYWIIFLYRSTSLVSSTWCRTCLGCVNNCKFPFFSVLAQGNLVKLSPVSQNLNTLVCSLLVMIYLVLCSLLSTFLSDLGLLIPS